VIELWATKEAWALAPQALWLLVCEWAYLDVASIICILCSFVAPISGAQK
jgi:hypothetical protein